MRIASKKQHFKNAKGITLLALVITIIVLIILAGVTISALLGDDGIVEQAGTAEEKTNSEGEKEQIQMAYNAELMNNKIEKLGPVTAGQLYDRLDANGAKIDSVIDTPDGFEITFTSGGKYSINVANKDVSYIGGTGNEGTGNGGTENEEAAVGDSKYFTFTLDQSNKTAKITGVKEEYAEYSYYIGNNGISYDYKIPCIIKDNGEYISELVIPSKYTYENNTYTVTAIGESAFGSPFSDSYNYQNKEKWFKSVTIPNSVTSIGNRAFDGQVGIEQINISDSVTSIGDRAFSYCKSLTSITIPSSVTSIGDYMFSYCTNLTSITIPNSVTSIGSSVFSSCSSLTSITIPNSVTSIGSSSFSSCSSLTSIILPNSVTSIGEWAFYECTNLQTVNYTGTEAEWDAITIGHSNSYLTNATKNYNYVPQ